MTIIHLKTNDHVLSASVLPCITCNSQNNVKFHVDFDPSWNEYAKSVVVYTSKNPTRYELVISGDGNCFVPSEVLAEKGRLFVGIKGVKTAGGVVKTTTLLDFKISEGTPSVIVSDPSADVYGQLLEAYNGVQKSISAERARIDKLLAPPANNSIDNARLEDICVSASGVTYDSPADAVRVGDSLGNGAQKEVNERGETTFAPYVGFTRGGLASGVISPYYKCRVPSISPISFDRDITLKIKDGFRVGVQVFDDSGNFSEDLGWRTREYTIVAGTKFMIVIARSATIEDNTETADFNEFVNAVTFDTLTSDEMERLDLTTERHDMLFDHIATRKSVDIKGAYHTTGGAGHLNNRIHAADFACDGLTVITFVGDTEYLYGVDLYTNDGKRTKISESGWTNTSDKPVYIVDKPCLIDLSISKVTALSFDSITEMDGLFTVSVYDTLASVRESMDGSVRRKKYWLTSAHQGFVDNALRPNSLAAYYNAYLNGADMIETDARLASDGVFVVNHDPTVTGTNAEGKTVTYTIAETPSSQICDLILSSDDKWGVQKVPTLKQVLNLAYHTGLIVNIDLKNGYSAAAPVAKMVLASGMQGKVIYALNGSGMTGINAILAIDPDARFIDGASLVYAVADFAERGKRCFCYTSDISEGTVNAIREGGCMLALISLNASNFESAMAYNPDMCEFLHTSDFRQIENDYFNQVKLY